MIIPFEFRIKETRIVKIRTEIVVDRAFCPTVLSREEVREILQKQLHTLPLEELTNSLTGGRDTLFGNGRQLGSLVGVPNGVQVDHREILND
jgi:hypothetical protein